MLGEATTMRPEEAAFTIADGDSPLMGALFRTALERRLPGCVVGPSPAQPQSGGSGVVTIRDERNGHLLCIFRGIPETSVIRRAMQRPNCSLTTFEASAGEFEQALEAFLSGSLFVSHRLLDSLETPQPQAPHLTPREADVLRLVARGCTNREAAHILGLSPNTVRTHLQTLSARMGVNSRVKLAALAREWGLG